MADGKEGRYITRKAIKAKTYKVYELGTFKELGEINIQGRPKKKEVAKQFGVNEVVLQLVKTTMAVYGMPVKDFMTHATELRELADEDEA